MSWSRTSRHTLACSPEELFRVLTHLPSWPRWNPGIARARLDDRVIETGTLGAYVPRLPVGKRLHQQTAPALRVTRFEADRVLQLEQREPLGLMRITWLAEPDETDPALTVFTQRVQFTGLSASVFARLLAPLVIGDSAENAVRLQRLASSGRGVGAGALRVLIADGDTPIGHALAADLLARGHDVRLLVDERKATDADPSTLPRVPWAETATGAWTELLADPVRTAIVNLAGEPLHPPASSALLERARDRRVRITRALVTATQQRQTPLAAFVQASSLAVWRESAAEADDDAPFTAHERTPVDEDAPGSAASLALAGEHASESANALRHAVVRAGLIIAETNPPFHALARTASALLGKRVGSGEQWVSWIHLDDWLAVMRAALGIERGVDLPSGIVLAVAPEPVRNAELMRQLAADLGRAAIAPLPASVSKTLSLVAGRDPEAALSGVRAISRALPAASFRFRYGTLKKALRATLH